jgi:hypothetical protein
MIGQHRYDSPEVYYAICQLMGKTVTKKVFQERIEQSHMAVATAVHRAFKVFILSEEAAFKEHSVFKRAKVNDSTKLTSSLIGILEKMQLGDEDHVTEEDTEFTTSDDNLVEEPLP